MPVPMITPTPKTVSWSGPSSLRSWCSDSSVSAIDCSIVFVRDRFMPYLHLGWPQMTVRSRERFGNARHARVERRSSLTP